MPGQAVASLLEYGERSLRDDTCLRPCTARTHSDRDVMP